MKQTPVTEEKFDKVIHELKNDILERLDDVVGQLETIRQEQILAYGQHKELEGKVDNHEKRISVLETSHS